MLTIIDDPQAYVLLAEPETGELGVELRAALVTMS